MTLAIVEHHFKHPAVAGKLRRVASPASMSALMSETLCPKGQGHDGNASSARGRLAVGSIPAMAIQRLRRPPLGVPVEKGGTLYEVELSGSPSAAWRAAFLRPPARLTSVRGTPELGRVGIGAGATVHFRTVPARLHAWLRRIDRWIAYANSVVEE
jgi:hypothetical protein